MGPEPGQTAMGHVAIQAGDVLDFWFSGRARGLWFTNDAGFDAEIRQRFGSAVGQALSGGFQDWRRQPEGALALLILLDQMARNIHRGTATAFAGDRRAVDVAEKAIAAGYDRRVDPARRAFFYLPFEHSEDPTHQARCVDLFAAHAAEAPPEHRAEAEDMLDYARRHAKVISRFGRFPHRNALLGRHCTPEEESFLADRNEPF